MKVGERYYFQENYPLLIYNNWLNNEFEEMEERKIILQFSFLSEQVSIFNP